MIITITTKAIYNNNLTTTAFSVQETTTGMPTETESGSESETNSENEIELEKDQQPVIIRL